jgi:hypothetical protein
VAGRATILFGSLGGAGAGLEMECSVMHKATQARIRLALAAWLALGGLALMGSDHARAAAPPERVLPESTFFVLKVNDAKAVREAFKQSQYGQLWADPAMNDFKADLKERLQEMGKPLQEKLGISVKELIELPQGPLTVAVVGRDDLANPAAVVVLADAGSNAAKMTDVMNRATKQAEESGAKVATESFQSATLHIVAAPEKDDSKPAPPLVWTNLQSVFYIGTDVAVIKDLLAHPDGQEKSLATNESFVKTQAKVGAASSHIAWFLDVAKLIGLVSKSAAKGQEAQLQQTEFIVEKLGLNGLKSIGGSYALNAGNYDSLNKTFFNAPAGSIKGLLKIFSLPKVNLQPEPWVPASVASYQSISFDLDNAYKAIDDLVNEFQPGMLQILQQQLVGPDGGEPLDFQKDVFGPLGNRVTIISDFKKPIKEDSQRALLAIALEDPKTFQNTFNRIIALAQGAPQKREFQGTTIYDFEVPNLPNPNPNGGNNIQPTLKGPISAAIAKNEFFVTTDTTLLEQVLRAGNPPLASSPAYQMIAKELPEKVSGTTYVRPDEQARLSYEMLKGGQFEKAFQQAAAARGGDVPDLSKLVDLSKLPDFSVFAKYLSVGGSYSQMDDDGFTMTGFTLRKSNP